MTVQDLLGPGNATNAVTSRPGDTRTFGALDTWFKDCSSPTASDGTEIQAGWLNAITGALRSVWRMNGNRLDGTTPVVTEDGTDDNGLTKSVQQLVQRGQMTYAADSSTTIGVVTVALSPAAIEYKTGLTVLVKMANDCTGATTINLNSLGSKSIVKAPGSAALGGGEWRAGDLVALRYDGTNFQGAGLGQRAPLAAAVDLYVNPSTGSDSAYDGSALTITGTRGPFATLTKALAIVGQFAPGVYGATIHLSGASIDAGTGYFVSATWAHCNVTITGAGVGSTTITGHSTGAANVLLVTGPNNYSINNCLFSYSGSVATTAALLSQNGAYLNVSTCNFSSVGGNGSYCVGAINGGTLQFAGTINFIASPGVSGNGYCITVSGGGANVQMTGSTLVTGAITFAAFIQALNAGVVQVLPVSPTITNGGSAGPRYSATGNAVINTAGGGANFFPGNAAGSTSGGGQYL